MKWMYEIGKQEAFKSVLKTEVSWSVKMPNEDLLRPLLFYGESKRYSIVQRSFNR